MTRVLTRIKNAHRCKQTIFVSLVSFALAASIGLSNWATSLFGTILSTLICAGGGVFAFLYFTRSFWRATPAGRAVLYLVLCFMLYTAQVNVANWALLVTGYEFGYPWRLEIRATLYMAILLVVINLILTLLELQRQGRSVGSKTLEVENEGRIAKEEEDVS